MKLLIERPEVLPYKKSPKEDVEGQPYKKKMGVADAKNKNFEQKVQKRYDTYVRSCVP